MDDTLVVFGAIGLSPDESKALADLVASVLRTAALSPGLGPALATALLASWDRTTDVREHIQRLKIRDLAIAVGVVHGDATAIASLLTLLDDVLRASSAGGGSAPVENVRQRLHDKLLGHDRSSVLRTYRGRGGLRSWLRVAVTRELLHEAERNAPTTSTDALEQLASPENPELAY